MSLGNSLYKNLKGDKVIWMIVALLSIISVLVVYSATEAIAFKYRLGNTESYLFKHLGTLVLGGFLLFICYAMHYHRFKVAAPYLLVIAVLLLVYTLILGPTINEARRWIQVPIIGLTFQTSDFAKIALVLFVAREITRHKDYIKDFNKAFKPIIVPIIIICGLIAPSDLSTAIMLFVTTATMMFVGRVDLRYIGLLLVLGIVLFAFLILLGDLFPDLVRRQTWISRMREFLHGGGNDYHLEQFKMAISNGKVFGVGPGNSVIANTIPHPYSDSVYGTIMEEYGLFGGFVVLALYVLMFFRVGSIMTKSDKSFGALVVMGLGLSLVMQAFVNMAVAVDMVPVTGQPLPLVSMGGTSIMFTCISIGMILSVSKYVEKTTKNNKQANTNNEGSN